MNSTEKLLKCEHCGSLYFEPVYIMYKMSPLEDREHGKGGLVPMDVFRCAECKYVNSEFTKAISGEAEQEQQEEPKSKIILDTK